jgi:heavy metal translocating P-type ATPase
VGIAAHLALRFLFRTDRLTAELPLLAALALGGGPLVYDLARKLIRREFGSDLLAGISIVTSVLLGEYLAGAIVVLMLSGGELLEGHALRNASSVLRTLAKRMPFSAHRKTELRIAEVPLDNVDVGDTIVVYPHEICPVDGTVTEGHGVMNEAFLTGEPFETQKAPGSPVISGAVNGDSVLTFVATRRAVDSRYARIMTVMRESERHQPRLRRLGDRLGAIYTPIAVAIALLAWILSGDPMRFLAVLVIATPCPLLIAIPVAIIGSISLAAKRSIIVKNPAVLEQVSDCRTAIFDKTGTLTYGEPQWSGGVTRDGIAPDEVLTLAGSVARYSKHPLARAIYAKALEIGLRLRQTTRVHEVAGRGLDGTVGERRVRITNRGQLISENVPGIGEFPPPTGGLECAVLVDDHIAATYRFRDKPRADGKPFIGHLGPKHHFQKIMIVSGDRESEVRYLADEVGISEIHAEQSPEEKLAIVRAATAQAKTLYVGDGINDAPAMMVATVGMAIGQDCDVAAEAADVVVMESSLRKVDEFMHISGRMRKIALQSAIAGMSLSVVGMLVAGSGHLDPVAGALCQEFIDVLAVLNALRAALTPRVISDMGDC